MVKSMGKGNCFNFRIFFSVNIRNYKKRNNFFTITEWVIWYHFGIGMKKQSLQTSLKKKHSKREPFDVVKKMSEKIHNSTFQVKISV